MSNRKYPHYYDFTRRKAWVLYAETGRTGPKCECCGSAATGIANIQTSWFRSDDIDVVVCARDAHTMDEMLTGADNTDKARKAQHAQQLIRETANREKRMHLTDTQAKAVDSTMGALK